MEIIIRLENQLDIKGTQCFTLTKALNIFHGKYASKEVSL